MGMSILYINSLVCLFVTWCFDPLTVYARSILLQKHFLCFNTMAEPAVADRNPYLFSGFGKHTHMENIVYFDQST
jgi:hypothetical protein